MLISTLINVSFQITNILSLIFLLLFIYSALGINLFATSMFREHYSEKTNFRDFPNAMMLLLRVATGDNWSNIMFDLSKTDSYEGRSCVENQTYSDMQENHVLGCGSNMAFPYFLSFIIIISFTVMNLSIAAIIDGLKAAKKNENLVITSGQVDKLIAKWSEYDPNATGWITVESLAFLIFELPPPIGYGGCFPEEGIHHENIYSKRHKENNLQSQIIRDSERETKSNDVIYQIEKDGFKYSVHSAKKIVMKETRLMQILGRFAIPVYKNTKVYTLLIPLGAFQRYLSTNSQEYV